MRPASASVSPLRPKTAATDVLTRGSGGSIDGVFLTLAVLAAMHDPDAPPPSSAPPPLGEPKTATFLQVAGAVFWSFFGVRKGRHMLQDTTTINPLHVVIVGVVAGVVFVLALIALVTVITRNAG